MKGKEMANNWGENRTGYDKELYDLGRVLQNIGSLETLRATISDLLKIEAKMEKERARKSLEKLNS